jgi:disulfide bond formation protein DsbB
MERLNLRTAAALLALGSAALLGGAFAFQYIGGLAPCILCWWQRYPHMVAIVLGLAGVGLARHRKLALALIGLIAVAMVADAGIAAFHVGVEQGWWEGTAECGSTISGANGLDDLLRKLENAPIVRCTDVAWSMFGISMAGYNLLASLGLAAFAAWIVKRDSTAHG